MKNMPTTQSSIVRRLLGSIAPCERPATGVVRQDIKVTLRVEDGVVHINNVGGQPEGVMYTLMAENQDGSTQLMTRFVALAPFQAFADSVEGTRVLAAWEKN